MENRLSKRTWLNILLFGFMGSVAWNVENMYFNTFLYNSIYAGASQAAVNGTIPAPSAISNMVAISAATAVITTFVMGTLSDKMRKRKVFISVGYIAWGIVTALFGFISRDNVAALFGLQDEIKILTFTVWTVIIMDAVMTFMGSTSNDSAFNAWVTDVTTESTRPKVEVAFTVSGFVAMAAVMGVGSMAQSGAIPYSAFFFALGVFVMLCGVAGLFLLKDPEPKVRSEESSSGYWSDLFYGFRPSVIRDHSGLYLCLASVCFFNVAVQVFFPYIFVYMQYVILPQSNLSELISVSHLLSVILAFALAAVAVVLLMKRAAKNKAVALIPAAVLFVAGMLGLFAAKNLAWVLVAAAPTVAGYLVLMIQLNASIRDFTPPGKAGLFQGIRMIFVVLIPMVAGPKLGELACVNSGVTYMDDYGVSQIVPSSSMFLYAAVVGVLIAVPLFVLVKKGVFRKQEAPCAVSAE
ncbi:MAG: MFS transporter [Oscillospiraceae bacterium]|nr:MFS transporter [Oscillospiraceae bacterium]